MNRPFRSYSSLLVLCLAACSGSSDEANSTPPEGQFITPEEEAENEAQADEDSVTGDGSPNAGTQEDDSDIILVPDGTQSGEAGSGVIVVEEEDDVWLIPDEGASFTGPPLQAG